MQLFEHRKTGAKAYAATVGEKNQLMGRGFRPAPESKPTGGAAVDVPKGKSSAGPKSGNK